MVIGLGGCSELKVKRPEKPAPIVPSFGYVNFDQVALADPKMPILKAVDMELKADDRYSASREVKPVDFKIDKYLGQVSAYGAVDVKEKAVQELNERLDAVRESILNLLDQRLTSAENLQLDTQRAESMAVGQTKLTAQEAALDVQTDELAQQFKVDQYQVASLKMQLAAIKVNELPPRNAPLEYWLNLEAQRNSQLTLLLSTYNAELKGVYEKRNEALDAVREQIAAQLEADADQGREAADLRRLQAIEVAKSRFDKEEEQLDTDNARVFGEARTVITSSRLTPGTGIAEQSSNDHLSPKPGNGREILQRYRSHLLQLILTDTRRSISETAKTKHITIVAEHKGVPNLTPIFLEAAKDQNWKVS